MSPWARATKLRVAPHIGQGWPVSWWKIQGGSGRQPWFHASGRVYEAPSTNRPPKNIPGSGPLMRLAGSTSARITRIKIARRRCYRAPIEFSQMLFPDTYEVNSAGHMSVGGCDLEDLARAFGTPLYVYDEATLRGRVGEYRDGLQRTYGAESLVLYAGKAFLSIAIAKLMDEEQVGLDLVSGGELYLAEKAEFPMERVFFPGNNKTLEEVEAAARLGIGALVVDSLREIEFLRGLPSSPHIRTILRVSPGIQPDTHSFIDRE